MAVVYEVNVSVDADIAKEYMGTPPCPQPRLLTGAWPDWLLGHMKEIVNISGFIDARVFAVEPADGAATNGRGALFALLACALAACDSPPAPLTVDYCAQYKVQSREALQHYFDHHAATMRADGINRFGTKFSAHRRVLLDMHEINK